MLNSTLKSLSSILVIKLTKAWSQFEQGIADVHEKDSIPKEM